ncbi:hypothetical protein Q7F20_13340 [Curtobacterium sp. A7_M15]|uniref:hypothetical protein n=1 Tax=Curtobacterium sp. A7_M15 TaxID=3065241 RepID=UPI002737BA8D|nr:hypothetical protein [Curtobacterium sp. A7_M15]MDP4334358.1 hypothetical protein [Curtobacterium sp. A7_M15]
MQRTSRAAKTGTLVLVLVGLGAGVVHALPEPADRAIEPTVERSVGTWAMPLDGWVQPGSEKAAYAEDLVVQPCLREAGIDFPPPWATVDGLEAASDAAETPERGNPAPALSWTRPLDEDTARTSGYHAPSTAGANRDGRRAWGEDPERNAAFADAAQSAVTRCFRQAERTVGTDDPDGSVQRASMTAKRLTFLAGTAAREDETVVAAAARWHTCMADADVPDLPRAPSEMPSQSMKMDYGTNLASTPVQDAEIAVAERDVSCQHSSGYRDALYDAEWRRLSHVTATDAAVLHAAEPDQRDVERHLDEVIRDQAPESPSGR